MAKQYGTFEVREDEGVVIAHPDNPDRQPIRLSTGWFDFEAGEAGRWEEAVGTIIRRDLDSGLELEDGKGTVDRNAAAEDLEEADIADSEDEAHALIDYFEHNGALSIERDDLVLLTDPSRLSDEDGTDLSKDERSYRMLSWAAAFDGLVDEMKRTIEEFEEAKNRIQENTEELGNRVESLEEKKRRHLQELRAIGPGNQIPDPEELDEAERSQFQQHKEDYAFYESLHQAHRESMVDIDQNVDQLISEIEKIEEVKKVYDEKVTEIRQCALRYEVFPGDAIGLAEDMGDLVAEVTGVSRASELAEEMDHTDLREAAQAEVGEIEEVGETAEEITERAEEADTTINQ